MKYIPAIFGVVAFVIFQANVAEYFPHSGKGIDLEQSFFAGLSVAVGMLVGKLVQALFE